MSSPVSPITSRLPLIEWTSRFVQPPGAQYVSKDDQLHLDVTTSFVPSVSELGARILTPEGEIHFQRHTVETTLSRVTEHRIFPAREGFLLGFAVSLISGEQAINWNYASVGLSRPDGGGAHVFQGLGQGYFDLGQPLFWPGEPYRRSTDGPGFFRRVTGADPAAGANISIEVPSNARWRPVALEAELVTDATVANRRFILRAERTGGFRIFTSAADAVQTASQSIRYNTGHWGESGGNRDGIVLVNWPEHVYLVPFDTLVSEVVNLQAGDNFGAPVIYVEEWFDEG